MPVPGQLGWGGLLGHPLLGLPARHPPSHPCVSPVSAPWSLLDSGAVHLKVPPQNKHIGPQQSGLISRPYCGMLLGHPLLRLPAGHPTCFSCVSSACTSCTKLAGTDLTSSHLFCQTADRLFNTQSGNAMVTSPSHMEVVPCGVHSAGCSGYDQHTSNHAGRDALLAASQAGQEYMLSTLVF